MLEEPYNLDQHKFTVGANIYFIWLKRFRHSLEKIFERYSIIQNHNLAKFFAIEKALASRK